MQVTVIPGVGPATAERLRRVGRAHGRASSSRSAEDELVRLRRPGPRHGAVPAGPRRATTGRSSPEREAKSVSVEDTYDTDLVDRRLLEGLLTRQAGKVTDRLRKHGLSGRTVTIKVRLHDFTTLSRSDHADRPHRPPPGDRPDGAALLADLDTSGGVRLLGVGVSGLADWIQEDLFGRRRRGGRRPTSPPSRPGPRHPGPPWAPGMDVVHNEHGPGWVWGSGVGVVTVRFETADTPAGPGAHLPRATTPG